MTVGRVFDEWVADGPFRSRDLGRYRVIFASSLLLMLPSYAWIGSYPDSLFSPPPGPFMLFSGFPPQVILVAFEIAVAVCAGFMLLGLYTVPASVGATLLLIVANGFAYSLGKIDHSILRSLTPLLLLFALWGLSTSIGAASRTLPVQPVPQWPLRLLALIIGLALFTASLPKIFGGWFRLDSQATQGFLFQEFYLNGRQDLLARFFVGLQSPSFWELLDWATILLEAGVILTIFNWRMFRSSLALLSLFHVGVYLMMNISFAGNVLVYAAFVQWGDLNLGRIAFPRFLRRFAPFMAIAVGLLAWTLTLQFGNASPWLEPGILLIAGLVSMWYLIRRVRAVSYWAASKKGRHAVAT